jgi:hypothetical protein
VSRWILMDGRECNTDPRIRQSRKDAAFMTLVVRPRTYHLYEQDLGESGHHRFVSRLALLDLAHDETERIFQRRVPEIRIPSDYQRLRQLVEQGVVEFLVKLKMAADQSRWGGGVFFIDYECAASREPRRLNHLVQGPARRVRSIRQHVLGTRGNQDHVPGLEPDGFRTVVDPNPARPPRDEMEPSHSPESGYS